MVFRTLSGFMAALFVFAVLVQYNDPDPIRWMAIYGLAAFFSLQAARGTLRSPVGPAIVALIALCWSLFIGRTVVGAVSLSELFQSVAMKTDAIEVGRESLGLLIVAVWLGIVALFGQRSRQ